MKKLYCIIIFTVMWGSIFAQTTFSQPIKSTITHVLVFIEQNSVIINGQNNNQLDIEIEKPIELPKMADGLQRVYAKGLEDNTQLGLFVMQEDSVLVIRQACNCHSGAYKIALPQNLNLTMIETGSNRWNGNYNNSNNCDECGRNMWSVKNMGGNINLTAEFRNIYLDNPTGVVKAESRYGRIRANLKNPKSSSFFSNYSKIELIVNQNVNADLTIKKCEYGEIFSDFDNLKIDESSKEAKMKLNNGGTKIDARSTYGNVFVRKSI